MEGCLAEMVLANTHLARLFGELQERLFAEDKALSREKAVARIRAKIPPPQTKLEDTTTAKELAKKKGKKLKQDAFYAEGAEPEEEGIGRGDRED